MSRRLERYVFRELVLSFTAATVVLVALFYALLFVRGSELLLGSAAELSDWVTLMWAMVPLVVPQVLPIALLLGLMIGFARLAEDGELMAMRAMGVSPLRLTSPALLLGALVSMGLAFTVVVWKPWGIASMRTTARQVIERNVLGDLKPGVIRTDLPGVVFHAQAIDGPLKWRRVLLIDERDASRSAVLFAPSAAASFEGGVGLSFREGTAVQRELDEVTVTTFESATLRFNVEQALNRRDAFRFGHEELSPRELETRAQEAAAKGESAAALWSAFHFRWSQLVAPVALAMVAGAISLSARRRGARTAAVVGVSLYLAYYVVARVAVQLGERSVLAAPIAGHLATVLAAVVGALWLWRLSSRGAA